MKEKLPKTKPKEQTEYQEIYENGKRVFRRPKKLKYEKRKKL